MSKKSIAIFCHGDSPSDNANRYLKAAKKLNLNAELYYNKNFSFVVGKGKAKIFYNNKSLSKNIIFLPTICTTKRVSTLFNILQQEGYRIMNNEKGIFTASNKTLTSYILGKAGLPTILSANILSDKNTDALYNLIPGQETILKINDSNQGKGVSYIHSKKSLKTVFQLLVNHGTDPSRLLLQPYIKEAQGKDIRVFVVGNKTISSVERTCGEDDFRSNITITKGSAREIHPSKKILSLAVKATKLIGLDYSGVDIIQTKKGPVIVEVNSNPSLPLAEYAKKDLAGEILKYIVK